MKMEITSNFFDNLSPALFISYTMPNLLLLSNFLKNYFSSAILILTLPLNTFICCAGFRMHLHIPK